MIELCSDLDYETNTIKYNNLQAIVTNHYLTNLFVVLFWNSTENQYMSVVLKSFVSSDFRTELENSKNIPFISNPVRVIVSEALKLRRCVISGLFIFAGYPPTTYQPLVFVRNNLIIYVWSSERLP